MNCHHGDESGHICQASLSNLPPAQTPTERWQNDLQPHDELAYNLRQKPGDEDGDVDVDEEADFFEDLRSVSPLPICPSFLFLHGPLLHLSLTRHSQTTHSNITTDGRAYICGSGLSSVT